MTLAKGGYALKRARRLPALLLMTDEARLPDPVAAVRRLGPGWGLILRHYNHPRRAALAMDVADACREAGVCLLVAGDGRLAAQVGAQGVHFPEGLVSHAGRWLGYPGLLLTAAAHSWPALLNAARWGADAALLSPVYATASKPGARPLGPLRFARMARRAPLPVYALGGITAARIPALSHAGAAGFAGIDGLSEMAGR